MHYVLWEDEPSGRMDSSRCAGIVRYFDHGSDKNARQSNNQVADADTFQIIQRIDLIQRVLDFEIPVGSHDEAQNTTRNKQNGNNLVENRQIQSVVLIGLEQQETNTKYCNAGSNPG